MDSESDTPNLNRPKLAAEHEHAVEGHSGVIETLQSLIVAFVLAMMFRSFVAEGFVIPTGSMAPTLLGQHQLLSSQHTGYEFAVGVDQQARPPEESRSFRASIVDPMLGPSYLGSEGLRQAQLRTRMGDRILVLKGLYAFTEPRRFDVVVFKNPTDPTGESQNYIKRLIGLPNETVWIADGDVFSKKDGDAEFRIRRKPLHVQRAVWQPIHHSDYRVMAPARITPRYDGPPWEADGWNVSSRSYRTERADRTLLTWNPARRSLDDWTAYNMVSVPHMPTIPVSDLRIAAGIVPKENGLRTTLELEARQHVFEFTIEGADATLRYRPADEPEGWIDERQARITPLRAGRVTNVEFWHVDQAMRLFINQREVLSLEYEWTPIERLENATGYEDDNAVHAATRRMIRKPELRWSFEGSPTTLHRVRVDRDLYYRYPEDGSRFGELAELSPEGHGYGTHPDFLATLGPDHFYMLGDNSQASLDSRLWGRPHPLIAENIDDSPFVVHRKLLLGKAWVVYFPAPYPITADGWPIIPDFGRLRYIR
jgi:signal peptidase I